MKFSFFPLSVSFLLTFPSLDIQAADIDRLFASVPQSVMPMLDQSGKLDLLDLYNGGLTSKCENRFGGQTEMISKTASGIELVTSNVGRWQMVVLPVEADTIIMTLHTLDAMGKSTDVRFYDTRWTPQPETVVTLKVPPFESFWCPPIGLDANQMNVYANLLREAPISAKWDPSHQTLEFSISTSALDAGIREQAAKCIYPVKLRFERKEAGWGFVE